LGGSDGLARLALLLAWLSPLASFLIGLGGAPLTDVDEGAFAQATRELMASDDWTSTTLLGQPRWDKPILIYWLQALSVKRLARLSLRFACHRHWLGLPGPGLSGPSLSGCPTSAAAHWRY